MTARYPFMKIDELPASVIYYDGGPHRMQAHTIRDADQWNQMVETTCAAVRTAHTRPTVIAIAIGLRGFSGPAYPHLTPDLFAELLAEWRAVQ